MMYQKPQDKQVKSFIFLSRSGCLLPLFIFFNLIFGRIFFDLGTWLLIEAVLILIFIFNALMLVKRVSSFKPSGSAKVIDTEGVIIEEGQEEDKRGRIGKK